METKLPTALDEKYLLGIPELDGQHKELADIAAKFRVVVASKDQRHLIHPVLRRLYHLLAKHFSYEETLMEMADYLGLPQHRKTHKGILKLLNDYFDHPLAPDDNEHFAKLIGDKVLGHVMERDAEMISAIREMLPSLPRSDSGTLCPAAADNEFVGERS